ncbi:MAG: dTDP-4-dehydrorhamnose 3,5-epimerase [Anaerolineales bacterium]
MGTQLIDTPLHGLKYLQPQVFRDDRGFFLESYSQRTLSGLGLQEVFIQDNHSRSVRGVLRGLHYQDMSAPMAKLVRCTLGVIFDVAVDLRFGSPTFGQWFGVELTEENHKQLFVPVGFAHGFAVLSEVADLQYKCTNYYAPQAEGAIRWDDADIGIGWRLQNPVLSKRDAAAMSLHEYLQQPAFTWSPESVADA